MFHVLGSGHTSSISSSMTGPTSSTSMSMSMSMVSSCSGAATTGVMAKAILSDFVQDRSLGGSNMLDFDKCAGYTLSDLLVNPMSMYMMTQL